MYRHQQWYRQRLLPVTFAFAEKPTSLYRQGGVYVVIGGAGGIGEAWSEYMLRTYCARLVWIGRSDKTPAIQEKLERLSRFGPAPEYIAADARDRQALTSAYQYIKQQYGPIHGVIHAAIVLHDQSLARMDEESFRAVLEAKVDVSVHLAKVFAREALDFVLFFSSFNAFVRMAGQSNYAAGCTFVQSFAAHLRRAWSCAVKVVNWGYWGNIGVVSTPAYRERMAQAGLGSIEAEEAMENLEYLLAGPLDQCAYLKVTRPLSRESEQHADELRVLVGASPALISSLNSRVSDQQAVIAQIEDELSQPTREMDELLGRLLWGQLKATGWFEQPQTSLSELRGQAGLLALYERWLHGTLVLLAQRRQLHYDAYSGRVSNLVPLDRAATWSEWERKQGSWLANPGLKAQVMLLNETLRALPEILKGRLPATDILFPQSSMRLVDGLYKNNPVADLFNTILAETVIAYLQERLQQDKAARIRILEIGAGTGGTSSMVLRKLQAYQEHIQEYCYTDLSQAFLWYAQQTYGPEHPYLACQLVDVESPLAEQGLAVGSYDLVIAANVLHATRNIHQAVRNVKTALKPHGLLLLNELGRNELFLHLTFGLLQGWWLYEDEELRLEGSPCLSPETWNDVLTSEGFNGVWFPSIPAHSLGQQIIVAQSDGVIRQSRFQPPQATATARSLPEQLRAHRMEALPPRPVQPRPGIVVPNASQTSRNIDDQMLEDHVHAIILESLAAALKVDPGKVREDRAFSDYGVDSITAVNLINIINKRCAITLQTTVLFDYNTVKTLLQHIVSEYSAALRSTLQSNMAASEGIGETPHIEASLGQIAALKERVDTPERPFLPVPEGVAGPAGARRVLIEKPGSIEDLKIIAAPLSPLRDNEVRVAVRAFSLNFGDLLCVKGLYPTMPPYPFTPGFEASGVIIEVGPQVYSVAPGDAVIVLASDTLGTQASVITCLETQVFAKPVSLSFAEACALPIAAVTMLAVFQKAGVKSGEKILIQTATGGTGLIAVQLARHYGAEIYATAGSQEKLAYLRQLGVSHLINYRASDFETEIKRLTQGKGVDVVINTLSGDALQKGMNCLAPGGRYVEIAMTALKSARQIDLSVLNNNQTFYSVDLRKLEAGEREVFKAYVGEMIRMVEQGIIAPTICHTFAFEQIQDAYRCLERRENIGKVVVSVPEGAQSTTAALVIDHVPSSQSAGKEVFEEGKKGHEPIAIIGMSGRFARSENVEELWEHLANGVDLMTEVSRWEKTELYPSSAKRPTQYCTSGSFLDDIDCFDPLFFNVSGLEATYMDPQQRLVLQESWRALEDAGYVGVAIEGRKCGVYVGCTVGDYQQLFTGDRPPQAFWGNAGSVIPARIAYYLNLHGPAIAVDTACSSSLVAMHLACQGLWTGETEIALAGGVFIQCTPEFHRSSNMAGMLSPRGRCATFDEQADGFAPGEAVGMVVLKRLKDALADGDHIYGVVRGSGINQDGATNGITAPSANSQERLERSVYETFQINPEQIQMVEAHGTGTKLGDPIEYTALTRAFRAYTDKKEYCAIGSLKSNLGHAATAAGVAGLIKVLLSLQHKKIPPTIHYHTGNAAIQFNESPFFVNTDLREWQVGGGARRCAAVSSFGFSGTNAHVVIEEAPFQERRHGEKPGYLITLSALTVEQLRQQVEQLVAFLTRPDNKVDCGNMSYTLLAGRKHLPHRLACVVHHSQEVVELLERWLRKEKLEQVLVNDGDESLRRETLALKRYGNQCIQECLSIAHPAEYLKRLAIIADLYIQGYDLAFEQLFAGEQFSRLALPTYPFAKERYWIAQD
ncbi:MAG TPA: SDR family NAD(P)-dependent oxidoreductase, partial [Ktedonobacteraceae bacterium]|nr:SDR family NAD(P)-dependent oxidoreductase [Ktedonobacteraceae bacterium]